MRQITTAEAKTSFPRVIDSVQKAAFQGGQVLLGSNCTAARLLVLRLGKQKKHKR